jgi:hypothetical protein
MLADAARLRASLVRQPNQLNRTELHVAPA